MTSAKPSIAAEKLPSFNSKAVVVLLAIKPNSAPLSFTFTASPADSSAVTLVPTAIISAPLFLNPMLPLNDTKSVTVRLTPVTEMLPAPSATLSMLALTELIVIVSFTVAPVLLNCTFTSVAVALPNPAPLSISAPEASMALVSLSFRSIAREPLLTPTSNAPVDNFAETPLAETLIWVPSLSKPKVPLIATKSENSRLPLTLIGPDALSASKVRNSSRIAVVSKLMSSRSKDSCVTSRV